MKVGAHIWIGSGLKKAGEMAVSMGCECIQIFLHNPRSWKIFQRSEDEISAFAFFLKEKNICPLCIHMPYVLNLASPDKEIFTLSTKRLQMEMREAEKMGADFYIIHPGSCVSKMYGLKKITAALNDFAGMKTKILIENTAGQGKTIGGDWEDFGYFFEKLKNFGVCFDTAHAFVSGNNFRNKKGFIEMKSKIEKFFPLKSIDIVHANDTLGECGKHIDRHQHLGSGFVGKSGFKTLLDDRHFSSLPFIIETPKNSLQDDITNLLWLRKMVSS